MRWMETPALIRLLEQDVSVREPLDRAVGIAVAASVVVAASLFAVALGPRADIMAALDTARFPFKLVVTGTLALTATLATRRIGHPGATPRMGSLLAAPLLLAAAVLTELVVSPSAAWRSQMIGQHALLCLTLIPALSIGPLACLLAALRRGAPADPGAAGAVAGLAASGIAAVFYAANCVDDSPLFVLAWYPLATGSVALAGYLIGRRVLRW